jgi:hypothetical protein
METIKVPCPTYGELFTFIQKVKYSKVYHRLISGKEFVDNIYQKTKDKMKFETVPQTDRIAFTMKNVLSVGYDSYLDNKYGDSLWELINISRLRMIALRIDPSIQVKFSKQIKLPQPVYDLFVKVAQWSRPTTMNFLSKDRKTQLDNIIVVMDKIWTEYKHFVQMYPFYKKNATKNNHFVEFGYLSQGIDIAEFSYFMEQRRNMKNLKFRLNKTLKYVRSNPAYKMCRKRLRDECDEMNKNIGNSAKKQKLSV